MCTDIFVTWRPRMSASCCQPLAGTGREKRNAGRCRSAPRALFKRVHFLFQDTHLVVQFSLLGQWQDTSTRQFFLDFVDLENELFDPIELLKQHDCFRKGNHGNTQRRTIQRWVGDKRRNMAPFRPLLISCQVIQTSTTVGPGLKHALRWHPIFPLGGRLCTLFQRGANRSLSPAGSPRKKSNKNDLDA